MTKRTPAEEVVDALENTAPWAIEAIRRDERNRLATLLEESSGVVGAFAKDGPSAVRCVAFMLTLNNRG